MRSDFSCFRRPCSQPILTMSIVPMSVSRPRTTPAPRHGARQMFDRREHLLLHARHHRLLAQGAAEVAVALAHPRELEGARAVELDLPGREAHGAAALVGAVDQRGGVGDRHAAEGVDHLREAREAHDHDVVDGHAGQALDRVDHRLLAAEVIRRVDLLGADHGQVHAPVAGDREVADAARVGVGAHDQDRVRAAALLARAGVDAQDQRVGRRAEHAARRRVEGGLAPGGVILALASFTAPLRAM